MDSGVEKTDSKIYVLWLAKRREERIAYTIDTHQHSKAETRMSRVCSSPLPDGRAIIINERQQ